MIIFYVFDTSLSPRLSASLRMLIPGDGEPVIVVAHDVMHITEEDGFTQEGGRPPSSPSCPNESESSSPVFRHRGGVS